MTRAIVHTAQPGGLCVHQLPAWLPRWRRRRSHRLLPHVHTGATVAPLTQRSYPLDIIRARLASQVDKRLYTGVWHGLRHMYVNEGLASFAKGMSPTLVGVLPYAGISFGTNDSLKKLYLAHFAPGKSDREIPTQVRLVCGAIAGLVAQTGMQARGVRCIHLTLVTVTYPLDLIRRQMQLHGFHYSAAASYAHKGTVDGVMSVWRREGHKGLYKGLSINYLKVRRAAQTVAAVFICHDTARMRTHSSHPKLQAGPMISLSFTINDTLKRWLDVKEVR